MKGAIFFTVSTAYFPLAVIQAVRALEMSRPEISVHVFVDGAGDGDVQFDPRVLAKSAGRLLLHHGVLANLTPDALPTPKPWPRAIYGRLFAPQVLDADRLLYLDVDIIIDGPLDELFSLDMRGAALAAAPDLAIEESMKRNPQQLFANNRAPGAQYFNAGMLLIDRELWLRRDVTDGAQRFYAENKGMGYFDQDILNYIFPDWLPISPRWNCLISFLETGLQEAIRPHVVHVTGFVKPWHSEFADQFPSYAEKFAAMVEAAQVDLGQLPVRNRTPGFTPMKRIRIYLHLQVYKMGIVGRRTRAHLANWRNRRAHYIAFLSRAAEEGLFADAFAFAPPTPAEPSQYDGRTFRARR